MHDIISNILDIMQNFNWGNFISVIVGASITALFQKRRERIKIKKDIQIKTIADLSETISMIGKNASNLKKEIQSINIRILYSTQKSAVNMTPAQTADHFKRIMEEKNDYFPSDVSKILKEVEDEKNFHKIFAEYSSSIDALKNKFDVYSIILKLYFTKLNEIMSEFKVISKIRFELLSGYRELSDCDNQNESYISLREEFDLLVKFLIEKIDNINLLLNSLLNKIQMDFIGDVFK